MKKIFNIILLFCIQFYAVYTSHAGMGVEKVMREIQARFYYCNGRYYEWPACASGTPAPRFPADGFYKDAEADPDFALLLVTALAHAQNSYGANFVIVPEGDNGFNRFVSLSEVASPVPPNSINKNNYTSKLTDINNYIKQQQHLLVPLDISSYARSGSGGRAHEALACETAKALARAEFSAAPWSDQPGKAISYQSWGWTYPEGGGYPPYYSAGVSMQRGTVSADFDSYPGKKATVYFKLIGNETPSDLHAPIAKVDGLWHAWKNASPSTGHWTSEVIPREENPIWEDLCDNVFHGWTLRYPNAVAIKDPDWITDPDSAKCDCACQGTCIAGTTNTQVGSVEATISLGNGSNGLPAGYFLLHERAPSSKLDSVDALTTHLNGAQLIGSGTYYQVKTPSVLAEVTQTGPKAWEIRFYKVPEQLGPSNSGLYNQSGKTPYHVISAESRWLDESNYDRFVLTEAGELGGKRAEFIWTSSNQESKWTLVKSDATGIGLLQETTSIIQVDTSTSRVEKSVLSAAGVLLSRSEEMRQVFTFGEQVVSLKIFGIDQSGNYTGKDNTTSYEYYQNTDSSTGAYNGLLASEKSTAGSWRKLFYDTSGRVVKEVLPFKNNFLDAPDDQCRLKEYAYSQQDVDGDGVSELVTSSTTRVAGIVAQRVFTVSWTAPQYVSGYSYVSSWEIAADNSITDVATAFSSPNSLITKTRYYVNLANGRVRSIQAPDGHLTVHEYSQDGLSETVYNGQASGNGSDVIAGIKVLTLKNDAGSFVSETTFDIVTGLLLSSKTATAWDSFGRPTAFSYLDGSTSSQNYDCCGLQSETDKQGITTTYTRDALGRVTQQTRAGVTTKYTLDALGRATKTESIAGGSSVITEQVAYDSFGNVVSREDALGRETTYSEIVDGLGQTIKTTTLPGGGTRIETYARDGSLVSVSGTALAPINYEYGVDADGVFTNEIRVGSSGELTEWTKSYTDFAGRPYKTVYADGASTQSFYNALGQLAKTVDQDGVTTLFAYNALGEQEVVALDLNRNGVIDFAGTDRITKTATQVTTAHGTTVRQSTTSVWGTDGTDSPVTVSISEASADGRSSWSTVHGLTTTSQVSYPAPGVRQETTTTPDGVQAIRQYNNDRLATNTVLHPSLGTLASASYSYDAFGRLQSTTDARLATTTYTYYDDDQIKTVTTPDPDTTRSGPGYDPQTTAYTYDSAGRLWQTTLPDATVTTQEYYLTGQLKKSSGSRTYPQLYSYDVQGRLKTLTTWQDYSGDTGKAVTTWNYDPVRGWLTSKKYADNTGPSYAYYASGRLKTRTWARGSVTTYSYNNGGDLASIAYSDTTPTVALTYDRRGRLLTTTDAAGVLTRSYDASGALQNEVYGNTGLLPSLSVNRTFDTLDRLSGLSMLATASSLPATSYNYDAASRLQTVTSGSAVATYGYLPSTSLLQTTTFTQGGATRLTTTKAYDLLNRLTSVTNTPTASTASVASYTYNAANQRNKLTREDGAYWDYGYDALGQLTSGQKKLSSGELLGGYDFGYAYDDIGNRRSATRNASSAVALAKEDYTANLLNQYTQRTVPGAIDVTGAAAPDATVTVNLQPTQRQGDRFYRQIAVTNTAASQNTTLTIVGVKNNAGPAGEDVVSQATKTAFTAQTPESFTYDLDGNLTADARWTYTWDAENRLTSMTTQPSAVTAGLPKQKLDFTYDAMGRRIQKTVSSWNLALGTWNLDRDLRFVYDGWNLLADFVVLGTSNLSLQCTYVWGSDLSGSLQGAGGVGGLLLTTKAGSTYATGYDGNGNVQTLINLADGSTSADFEYDPFGNTIKATGAAANVCLFGFSTKYTDSETGLLYYGFRYYNPSTGRWLSRDPIEEQGGAGLYSMTGNDAINVVDIFGLTATKPDEYGLFEVSVYEGGLGGGAEIKLIDSSDFCCDANGKKHEKGKIKLEITEEVWIGVGAGGSLKIGGVGFDLSFRGPRLKGVYTFTIENSTCGGPIDKGAGEFTFGGNLGGRVGFGRGIVSGAAELEVSGEIAGGVKIIGPKSIEIFAVQRGQIKLRAEAQILTKIYYKQLQIDNGEKDLFRRRIDL